MTATVQQCIWDHTSMTATVQQCICGHTSMTATVQQCIHNHGPSKVRLVVVVGSPIFIFVSNIVGFTTGALCMVPVLFFGEIL